VAELADHDNVAGNRVRHVPRRRVGEHPGHGDRAGASSLRRPRMKRTGDHCSAASSLKSPHAGPMRSGARVRIVHCTRVHVQCALLYIVLEYNT
jgi:hypothetical protein